VEAGGNKRITKAVMIEVGRESSDGDLQLELGKFNLVLRKWFYSPPYHHLTFFPFIP
jgi:hypothetical protein